MGASDKLEVEASDKLEVGASGKLEVETSSKLVVKASGKLDVEASEMRTKVSFLTSHSNFQKFSSTNFSFNTFSILGQRFFERWCGREGV